MPLHLKPSLSEVILESKIKVYIDEFHVPFKTEILAADAQTVLVIVHVGAHQKALTFLRNSNDGQEGKKETPALFQVSVPFFDPFKFKGGKV